MTQLPFPSHPSPLPPAPNPQPTIPYDHHRRTSVSSIASSRVSRTPFAHEVPYQASPQLPYPSDLPRYSLVNPAPGYSPALPRDPGHPAYQGDPVSRSPIPPPRRSATLPSTPSPIAQYSHQAASVVGVAAVPAEDPVAAHHRTLVAYYWHYAQQGFSAPLTALFGTDEYGMQERARREAVDWARQCGMAVKEPETQNGGEGGEEAIRARTTSRPLPSAPSPAATVTTNGTPPVPLASRPASIVGIGSGRPLPSAPSVVPHRSISLANPPHPIIPAATPPSRSVSEAQPRTQPFPPSSSASPLPASPFTVETLPSGRKRPLPMPPAVPASPVDTAQIGDQLQSISISAPPPARSPSPKPAPPVDPSIPTFTFGDESTPIVPPPRSPSPHPAPPAVPTFSFNDEPEQTSPSPAVPSFSFSVDEDPSPSPTVASSRRAPPVHPRYDPSHPSHALYHPTSVASPLPQSNSHPTIPTLTEAGTIDCTSCQLPIFGRVLLALSRSWHPGCFVCAEEGCAEKLEVMEFEGTPEDWEDSRGQGQEEDESLIGKAWCMVHFEERFALQCYHCHTPISSADYLPISDPSLPPLNPASSSNTRYYHPLHFFCAGCGDPFLDPVAYERSGEAIAMPYYVREQHPYCEKCDLRIWRAKCPGCRKGLREEDGYVEIGGEGEGEKKKWHEGCFKCSMCLKPLSGIYLLRADPTTSADDVPVERPYCGECYDIVAKEEASAAVA